MTLEQKAEEARLRADYKRRRGLRDTGSRDLLLAALAEECAAWRLIADLKTDRIDEPPGKVVTMPVSVNRFADAKKARAHTDSLLETQSANPRGCDDR